MCYLKQVMKVKGGFFKKSVVRWEDVGEEYNQSVYVQVWKWTSRAMILCN